MNTAATVGIDLTEVFGEHAKDLLDRCVAALRGAVPVEEIWLFGSFARGSGTRDSDVDLLVVLADEHGLARPNLDSYRAVRALRSGVPMDVLVVSKSQWQREHIEPFGVLGEVVREGIQLYDHRRDQSPAHGPVIAAGAKALVADILAFYRPSASRSLCSMWYCRSDE